MSIKSRAPFFANVADKAFGDGPGLSDYWSLVSANGPASALTGDAVPAGAAAAQGPIAQNIALTAGSLTYTQNFDTLASTGTSSTLPTDWFISESGTAANNTYGTGTGSSNTGDTYSFGFAGVNPVTDRALGQLRSSSVVTIIGASFTNSTGAAIDQLSISYVGEQWRFGAVHTTVGDKMSFQYSTDATSLTTGTWTSATSLDFASPVTGGTVGALDGNAAANHTSISAIISSLNIADGTTFWIRWVDTDATGSDDGLAIDDFSITAHNAGPNPGSLSIGNLSQAEGDSGTTAFTFTITRSGGSLGAVTADYAVAGSGAHPADATDFSGGVLPSGVVSFADGQTSQTITVNVQGDHVVESNETFAVTLSNPTGGVTIATATGTGTITNDDVAGSFSLDGDHSASEAASLTFTVNRTGGTAGAATLDWAVSSGTGAHPVDAADFGGSLPTGHVDFVDGQTSATITITPNNDSDFELDETFTLTLSNPTAGTIGTATATGTITNDDAAPPVGVLALAADASAFENAGMVSFTVNRTGGSTGAVDVDYVVSASGTHPANAADFGGSLPGGTVHFLDGQTTATIDIPVAGDHDQEPDETFTVTLSNPTGGASLGATTTATGTIQNDDTAGSFALDGDHSGSEAGGPITFTVNRTGGSDGAVDISYAVTGSGAHAADGADFGGALPSGTVHFADGDTSETILITPSDDSIYENDETFTLTLSNPTNGAIGTATATGTILNDEPVPPSLSVGDVTVIEGDAGTTTLVFTVTASFPVPAGGLSVDFATADGTATAGSGDYVPASGTLNFAQGDTTATVSVTVNGDTLFERNESVLLNLSNPVNALIGDGQGVGTIGNDDPVPPTAALFSTDFASFTAGGFAPGGVAGGLDSNIWRVVGLSDIPTPAFGFTATTGDFARGVFGTTSFPATAGVYAAAGDHALIVQPTGAELDAGGFIEARIQNNSGATATSFDVAFDWAYRNSADRSDNMELAYSTDGINFTTVTMANFSTPTTHTAVATDPFTDVHENLSLTGTVADGGYLYLRWVHDSSAGSGSRDEVGIDNVAVTAHLSSDPTGTISDISVSEGNAGTSLATFTITRSNGTGAASVDYATSDVTAVHGSDYVAQTGTVNFADGELVKTISVVINGDTAHEADESFTVNLSNAVGFVTPVTRATATIVNDDSGPVAIYDIQGLGHTSPFNGQVVTTTGIVTAVDTNGYYLQDPTGDGNSNTSDAVFVFTSSAPTVHVGDGVSVTGTVNEFGTTGLTTTEINTPTTTVLTTGNPLPAAVLIGVGGLHVPSEVIDDDHLTSYDPQHDAIDFYESIEGMLVTVRSPSVVQDTDPSGDTYVVASDGLDATGLNARGGLTLEPGDTQPERINIATDAGINPGFTNPHWTQGDQLGDVTGVVTYFSSDYHVVPTTNPTLVTDVSLPREVTTLHGDADHLSIGTYNLENYDPNDHKEGILANDLINNLGGPDIIGVEEVQDDNGTGTGVLTAQQNLTNLVNAMNALDPTANYKFIEVDPTAENTQGGEPDGNIRNAFIYDANRVTYVDGSVQQINGPAFTNSRPPLVAQFEFNGQTITAIDMHSYSRGGSDPDFGSNQPPAISGDDRRTAMGQAVRDWLDAHPQAHTAVMGDFNGYYYEGGLQALQNADAHGAGLTNLAVQLLTPEERYSYQFDGANELFDNILVSGELAPGASYDSVHLNAEYFGNANRPTDHDPQVALIFIPAPVANADSVSTDEASPVSGNVLSNDTGAGTVSAVNGVAADVGSQIALASGALLTLNADGTFNYDPNHAFDATPAAGSGASNTMATDSFTYTLATGSSATVTLSVTGVDSNDLLIGTSNADALSGGIANDVLVGGLGADVLSGGAGTDTASYADDWGAVFVNLSTGQGFGNAAQGDSYSGIENVTGSSFGDFLIGDAGVNVLDGAGGNDSLIGGLGADLLVGGAGNDTASYEDNWGSVFVNLSTGQGFGNAAQGDAYSGIENVIGTSFDDFVIGDAGVNRLDGGAGNDTLIGGLGADVLVGGAGSDTVSYEDNWGAVFIDLANNAGHGNAAEGDTYSGIENVNGSGYADLLIGDGNANILDGKGGSDQLVGGAGADTFAFTTALGADNVDEVVDFAHGTDKIALDHGIFTGLGLGALNASAFVAGTAAGDADDRIIYDASTGKLWFDADGNGAGAAVLVAMVDGHPTLTASDFQVI